MSEDELVWEISPHTAAKHSILKKYIQAWAPILGQGSNILFKNTMLCSSMW